MREPELRPPGSALLHRIDHASTRPVLALLVAAGNLAWLVASSAGAVPGRWQVGFQTFAAAVTVTMVFVLQHTQAREQSVTQRKLDELLRALPRADKSIVRLEEAPDRDLARAAGRHQQIREEAVGPPPRST